MERILIYKDQHGLWEAMNRYKALTSKMQPVLNIIKDLGVQTTKERLTEVVMDRYWENIRTEMLSELSGFPALIREAATVEAESKIVKAQALNLVKDAQDYWTEFGTLLSLDYITVSEGKVSLDPKLDSELEESYSIYADSEGRQNVYNAFKAAQSAIEALNQAVSAAEKREPEGVEQTYCQMRDRGLAFGGYVPKLPNDIQGVRPLGEFSIASIDTDGSLVLKGENFSYLK